MRQSPPTGRTVGASVWHAGGVDDDPQAQKVQRLVARVLSEASFAGQAQLAAQVPYVRLGEGPITFIPLVIDRSVAPRSAFECGPVPGSAWVVADDGSPIGTLLVWVDDGYISALEYAWVTDNEPTQLPEVGQIRLGRP
jgi:hypothetical protein